MARREGGSPPRAQASRTASSLAPGERDLSPLEADMPDLSVSQPTKRPPGRPPRRKPVVARHSVRLDKARHEALTHLAETHDRSIHSLIIEAIDALLRKPDAVGLT